MLGTGAFLVAVLVCLLFLHYLSLLQSLKRYPPGPFPLPIIGSLWQSGTRGNQHFFTKLTNQYGNVYTLWIVNIPVVVLSGFQAVKEGLINHSQDFSERPVTPFAEALFKGRGILFSNGHTWNQQRRFGQVTMRKLGLGKKGLEHQIQDIAQQLVEAVAQAKGQPLDPAKHIMDAVSNVISAMAFGHQFSTKDKDFQTVMKALDILLKFSGSISHVLYEILPWLMRHLPGPHKKTLSAMEAALSLPRKEIERHKTYHSRHEPQDFIDFYLMQMEKSKNDPNSTFEEDNLSYSIFELFGAGSETTKTPLQWALLLMATHPDIQDRVHKEMEDVCGSSQLICYQDRKYLPYTNAVLHEIQRFQFAVLFGAPRQCATDVNMLGCFIPKGTIIIPDLRSVLLDPKQWATPKEFNPNHFLDKEGHFVDREEFLAFGAGHRVCLGELLARMELFIFFTSLLRAFKFQLPEGVKELSQEPVLGITTPPHPYKLCCIPRCGAPSAI